MTIVFTINLDLLMGIKIKKIFNQTCFNVIKVIFITQILYGNVYCYM